MASQTNEQSSVDEAFPINVTKIRNYALKPYIILIALALNPPVFADSDHPSIMFKKPSSGSSDIVTAPDRTDELTERCEEMSKQIDRLKGKPQRRNIAIKRYDIECKGQSVDYDRYENHGIAQDTFK